MGWEFQVATLRRVGASGTDIEELQRYLNRTFTPVSPTPVSPSSTFEIPLPDESFVPCWAVWCEEAESEDTFGVLARYLPQLRFPIQEGMSVNRSYRAATARGQSPDELAEALGLEIEHPHLVELELYQSFAGRIPLLIIRGRAEFVAILRALGKKNEPVPISAAQGAAMIAGYVNWERVRQLRHLWEQRKKKPRGTWHEELAEIRKHKDLYQDRFILLSDGPYSAVPAADLGISAQRWQELSLIIRREHECTHYYTRRVFGSMKNHIVDELMADYAGLVAALGRYRADWFLRFVGLDSSSGYRRGSRLEIYRGDPPLSNPAFIVLQQLLRQAARNLERFDTETWRPGPRSARDLARTIQALAQVRLEELASDQGPNLLAKALGEVGD